MDCKEMSTVFDEVCKKFESLEGVEWNWKMPFQTYVVNDRKKAEKVCDAIEFFQGARPEIVVDEHPECGMTVFYIRATGYVC